MPKVPSKAKLTNATVIRPITDAPSDYQPTTGLMRLPVLGPTIHGYSLRSVPARNYGQ